MVETTLVEEQLKKIKFNTQAWNRAETLELATIILPNEEIFECANGWYEGGFALICATNIRVLLVDKKPFKYLTVEDIRFDMINEIDYSHRLFDARIRISTGPKVLTFRSFNQQKLRKLISHVQHRMAEIHNEQTTQNTKQQEHLKKIDQSLQSYLLAQYQQQETMRRQLDSTDAAETISTANPSGQKVAQPVNQNFVWDGKSYHPDKVPIVNGVSVAELYEEGRKEVFKNSSSDTPKDHTHRIPFANLPDMFRHRQFGRTLLKELFVPHTGELAV